MHKIRNLKDDIEKWKEEVFGNIFSKNTRILEGLRDLDKREGKGNIF